MSTQVYFDEVSGILARIRDTQAGNISRAAAAMAESVLADSWVYLFGSGHSVLPVLDVYPRYGSFIGFRPLMDPRLMWFNVVGPGGAPELLWLERQEGYVQNFLKAYRFTPSDSLLVYSHGGLNAAPIEAALYAGARGLKVIAVTSLANRHISTPQHSSGKALADVADIVIDNCVPAEDALVDVGQPEKVAAGSTFAVVAVSMALVAETARILKSRGVRLDTFVSPNVPGIVPGHNEEVFKKYQERLAR
jgi:uncharacterized phosphosugar-binding protein